MSRDPLDNVPDSAFPYVVPENWRQVSYGMSLRDYLAGQALVGLMGHWHTDRSLFMHDIAKFCYEQADEMLKAREAS